MAYRNAPLAKLGRSSFGAGVRRTPKTAPEKWNGIQIDPYKRLRQQLQNEHPDWTPVQLENRFARLTGGTQKLSSRPQAQEVVKLLADDRKTVRKEPKRKC
jgi:hypothetical protein